MDKPPLFAALVFMFSSEILIETELAYSKTSISCNIWLMVCKLNVICFASCSSLGQGIVPSFLKIGLCLGERTSETHQ